MLSILEKVKKQSAGRHSLVWVAFLRRDCPGRDDLEALLFSHEERKRVG
jgi:hypothetical protein